MGQIQRHPRDGVALIKRQTRAKQKDPAEAGPSRLSRQGGRAREAHFSFMNLSSLSPSR